VREWRDAGGYNHARDLDALPVLKCETETFVRGLKAFDAPLVEIGRDLLLKPTPVFNKPAERDGLRQLDIP
jgi:hypothetical protein